MSTEAAILKGKGIVSNPAFFMIFILAACLFGAGVGTMVLSWLDFCGAAEECGAGFQPEQFQGIRFFAIILVVIIGVLFAVAWFTGLNENLFIGLIVAGGFLSGMLACGVLWHMWAIDAQGNFYEMDRVLTGVVLAAIIAALPPVVLVLEKYGILPLFMAIAAAGWGVMSVIVFVMVVFIGVE